MTEPMIGALSRPGVASPLSAPSTTASKTPATPSATAEASEQAHPITSFFQWITGSKPEATEPPKGVGYAEKLFCGKLGVSAACSDETVAEGRALFEGFSSLFGSGKDFLEDHAKAATDVAKDLFDDPKGFYEKLTSGPRHGSPPSPSGGPRPVVVAGGIRPKPAKAP